MSEGRRLIGIRHRVKRTADGEAHPTQVAIFTDGRFITYDLATEQDELDFVWGRFPVAYRATTATDDPSAFEAHHLKWRELKEGEATIGYPDSHLKQVGKKLLVLSKVPERFGGLQPRDIVAMTLGGSGNNLAFAMSRRGLDLQADIYRVPPHVLKDFRGDDKTDDAKNLVRLYQEASAKFYRVGKRDRNLIQVQEAWRLREEAMKGRIAVEQRLHQVVIGSIFCNEEGLYPEGELEKLINTEKANDAVFQNALMIEKRSDAQLNDALNHLPVYTKLFSTINGVGPLIAARIISVVGDIRLFWEPTDEARMAALYDEAERIEQQYYEPIKSAIKNEVQGMDPFHRLGVVFKHYRALNNRTATNAIARAIDCHKERSLLKRKAQRDGQSNLKAFLGVHLVQNEAQDWVFPRQRRGTRCNWSPTGRQGMYLLDDQFVKRSKDPNNLWGQKRQGYKKALRAQHPEEVKVQVPDSRKPGKTKTVTRYTNGHIHNMARWRTLTRFAEWLFVEWSKIALEDTGGEI